MRYHLILLFIALIPATSLTACGFKAVHAPQNNAEPLRMKDYFSQIQLAAIREKRGQDLRNLLIDRLYQEGYPITPIYMLTINNIEERKYTIEYSRDGSATRTQLRLNTTVTLMNQSDKNNLFTYDLSCVNSYNTLDSDFNTLISRREARSHCLRELSNQIVQRLEIYFSRAANINDEAQ